MPTFASSEPLPLTVVVPFAVVMSTVLSAPLTPINVVDVSSAPSVPAVRLPSRFIILVLPEMLPISTSPLIAPEVAAEESTPAAKLPLRSPILIAGVSEASALTMFTLPSPAISAPPFTLLTYSALASAFLSSAERPPLASLTRASTLPFTESFFSAVPTLIFAASAFSSSPLIVAVAARLSMFTSLAVLLALFTVILATDDSEDESPTFVDTRLPSKLPMFTEFPMVSILTSPLISPMPTFFAEVAVILPVIFSATEIEFFTLAASILPCIEPKSTVPASASFILPETLPIFTESASLALIANALAESVAFALTEPISTFPSFVEASEAEIAVAPVSPLTEMEASLASIVAVVSFANSTPTADLPDQSVFPSRDFVASTSRDAPSDIFNEADS